MHCTSCSDNKIKFKEECFIIHDNISKTFYNPDDPNKITSCYEYHKNYIKENENECIPNIEKGYFVSNSTTGLLSKCHENCLSCNEEEERDSEGKLINMKCTECKDKDQMIKNEGNCFPIITYINSSIVFNISEIDPNNILGNCLYFNKSIFYGESECIDKPINTFYVLNDSENTGVIKKCDIACNSCYGEKINNDTNCIECANDYYKIEDSNTNCILQNLIPNNYYWNDAERKYSKCHPNCYNCSGAYDLTLNDMKCLSCIDEHYFLYNDKYNNCYSRIYLNESFYLKDNTFYPCDENCLTCSARKNNISNNCLSCDNITKGLYLLEDLNNCEPKNYSGSYLDNDTYILKKCYQSCKTCTGYIEYYDNNNKENHNCIECAEGYYKSPYELYNNNCYNNIIINSWNIIKSNSSSQLNSDFDYKNNTDIEDDNITRFNTWNKELFDNYTINNISSSQLNTDYDYNNISNGIEENIQTQLSTMNNQLNIINTTQNEKISENIDLSTNNICYFTCRSCKGIPLINETENTIDQNCIDCIEGYYLMNETHNCYNDSIIEEGFYLDNEQTPHQWKKCHEKCKTCDKSGNSKNMNCLSCISNLRLNKDNDCIENCPNDLYLTLTGECSPICPEGSYQLFLNHACVESCPDNYEKNKDKNKCVKISFDEETSLDEIKNDIISYQNSSVINGPNFKAIISSSDELNPKEQIKKGISAVDLGNCTNVIKEYYNISKDENLIILNIEYQNKENQTNENNNDNFFNLRKSVQVEIFDSKGKQLNLSVCKEDITVMKYIGDVIDELNIESAKNFANQGIDIFNANDSFFNDLCHKFDNFDEKDIIISDRRKYIYQNVSFCEEGCSYIDTDFELMIANCKCNSDSLQKEQKDNDNKDEISEDMNFKKITKSFISNLLDFNIEVIFCTNLVFDLKILLKNIGFFFMSGMLLFQFIFLFSFLNKKLIPIKKYMLNFSGLNIPANQVFPPKKHNLNTNSNEDNNQIKNNNIKYKMKINKDIRNINLKGDEQTQKQLLNKNIRNKNKKRTSIKLDSFSKNSLLTLNNKSSNFVDKKQLKGDKLDFGKEPSPNVDIKNIIFNVNQNKKNAFSIKKLKENRKNLFRFNKNKKNKRDSIVSMETIVGKENKKNKNLNNLSQTDEDLQDMDYEEAIKYDKRSIFKIYWSFLVDSQIILGTFCTDNFLNLFVIKLSFFIFTFEISFSLTLYFTQMNIYQMHILMMEFLILSLVYQKLYIHL